MTGFERVLAGQIVTSAANKSDLRIDDPPYDCIRFPPR